MKSFINSFTLTACLTGLSSAWASPFTSTEITDWWRNAVFYEIFVRSFADSTTGPLAGDGIGDLRGIIERLDYLNDGDPATTTDLGITAIWLMPIAESPSYHGYDVTNYKEVDPEYGTEADFLALMDACHARGIRVIVDTVINHCSIEHPWFQKAVSVDSETHDWFVWTDAPARGPGEPQHTVWHPQFQQQNGMMYYGWFWHGMPDFNLRSPDATAMIHDFSKFWLTDMHADGLRLDAIKHLIEDGVTFENTPETLDWLADYNTAMHREKPSAFLVGEVWSDLDTINRYIERGVDSAFAFPLASAIQSSINGSDTSFLVTALADLDKTGRFDDFSTFIGNHDMDRILDRLGGSMQRSALAATLLMTLPGTPFIYYGEEIGMTGTKPDPDIRTPMQWTSDASHAGFTTGKPWRELNNNTRTVNVEVQDERDGSLLNHYRRLIRLRSKHKSLSIGSFTLLETAHDAVLAYERTTATESLMIVVNLSDQPIADYRIHPAHGEPARELLHSSPVTTNSIYPVLELAPYTGYVIDITDNQH